MLGPKAEGGWIYIKLIRTEPAAEDELIWKEASLASRKGHKNPQLNQTPIETCNE